VSVNLSFKNEGAFLIFCVFEETEAPFQKGGKDRKIREEEEEEEEGRRRRRICQKPLDFSELTISVSFVLCVPRGR
jgi:hypothetical protein